MSFLSKALRRAEVFLEQVDESVAQASRRMVVEGAVGGVDEQAWSSMTDDPAAIGMMSAPVSSVLDDDLDAAPVARRQGVANIRRASDRSATSGMNKEKHVQSPLPGSIVKNVNDAVVSQNLNRDSDEVIDRVLSSGRSSEATLCQERRHSSKIDVEDDLANDMKGDQDDTSKEEVVVQTAVTPDGCRDHDGARRQNSVTDRVASNKDKIENAEYDDTSFVRNHRSTNLSGSDDDNVALDQSRQIDRDESVHSDDVLEEHGSSTEKTEEDSEGHFESSHTQVGTQNPLDTTAFVGPGPSTAKVDTMAMLNEENEELRKELELAEEDFESLLKERAKHVGNLHRLKQVVSDLDESLRHKSSEVRRLESELVNANDLTGALRKNLKESIAKGKDDLDLARKTYENEIKRLKGDYDQVQRECDRLHLENVRVKEALKKGQEVDMATADDAHELATRAQEKYEQEVAAHHETRKLLESKQEALEAGSALTAQAIASAERRAEEAQGALAKARASQRLAENKLAQVTSARDAALARIDDLTETVSGLEAITGGQTINTEELSSLHQTVAELENALQAKNVELTRLEGDVENMRRVVQTGRDISSRSVENSDGQVTTAFEVEQKLRHMADSALRKQAQIEAIRAENNALQHQLGTERKRTREAQAMAAAATSSRQTLRGGFRGFLDNVDEESGERGFGVREGPIARFRAPRNWPRLVIRILGSLDSLSAKALGILRKEPILRMILVTYMFSMHVLIYCVLHLHIEVVGSGSENLLRTNSQKLPGR